MTPERLKEIRDALQDTEEQIPGQQLDPADFAIKELLTHISEMERSRKAVYVLAEAGIKGGDLNGAATWRASLELIQDAAQPKAQP